MIGVTMKSEQDLENEARREALFLIDNQYTEEDFDTLVAKILHKKRDSEESL
jgi:hypothetical protein